MASIGVDLLMYQPLIFSTILVVIATFEAHFVQ
jgi:hypothetical protein